MKTILVDKEPLMRRKLEEMVGDIKVVDVIGSFGSSKEALGYAERNTVEFAILDTEMPEMDGVELGKALKNIYQIGRAHV